MADYRAARDADLLVVSPGTNLRWLEWLVLCFSADGRGDDAFFAPFRGEAAQLRLRKGTTAKSKEQNAKGREERAKCHKEREKFVMPRLNVSQSHNNWSVSAPFSNSSLSNTSSIDASSTKIDARC